MNKELVKVFFPEEVRRFEKNLCPFCKKKVDIKEFRDEISKREFGISGLCQKCQDKTFE